MFTGIIDQCGILNSIEKLPQGIRLGVSHHFQALELGESIAIDGICLTVTHWDATAFYCDISPETYAITTAKHFQVGQTVNLERALQLSSRLGGHFVMGHVDQIAYVKKIDSEHDFTKMTFTGLNEHAMKFIIKKGSITINGVSLTINEITNETFNVMLIPHTLERTNLKHLQENSPVNIEFDMLVRIVITQSEKYQT